MRRLIELPHRGGRLCLIAAALLGFTMWLYVDRIWAPPVDIHYSDLYPRWYGSRELLLHGRDPYSSDVTREIQLWAYGRTVDPHRSDGPRDEDRFAYPLYVAFLLAPTLRADFNTVQAVFRILLPILAIATIPLWLVMLNWTPPRHWLGVIFILAFFNFPVLESLYLQQSGIIAAFFVALGLAALVRGRLGLAGVCVALSTIKPQLTALLVLWLLAWAFADWQARKRFVLSFGASMLVLTGVAAVLLPRWIPEFITGTFAYQRYTGNLSILSVLLTRTGGALAAVALVAGVAVLCWKWRRCSANSYLFQLATCLVLVTTVVVIPTIYPTGQILLVAPVLFILRDASKLWNGGRASRLALIAVVCLIGWQWMAAFLFALCSAWVPFSSLRRFWIVPVSCLLIVPLALLVLYAIRIMTLLKEEHVRLVSVA